MPTRQIGKSARHAQPSDARSTSRMTDPNVTARIYTESGGWALPTIDADGLAAIALLRFCNINFSLSTGASRSMTTANLLPVVIFENPDSVEPSVCAGLPSLIALLTANITLPDPNHHLTPFMIAESTAFATLVTSRFAPARLYELYLNDSNYQLIYHTLLESNSSFPLNRLLPYLNRRQVRRHLADRRPDSLYFDADIALAALSTRLGDRNRFFYGDEPSVLDAIVFGYLATVLYVPLPCTELRAQVAKFSNLVAFVARVQQQFFARDGDRLVGQLDNEQLLEECRRTAARRAREQQDRETEVSEEETTRRKWNRYFVIASAAAFAAHVLLANEIEIEYE
ncbi:Metaxin-1 [Gracilariopsis chorda]|uniref:Metaxin-1 n=1 Tax=Gracilariopsis chorda TaxID=448386 RepID=A0A2V3IRN6_9FLOR|nr:Metaxin-1 [Gracilariopsis chorda]|eukprot:PXF44786.1 Metaxin-1 [Gracilariopsis chorda]